jgi:hypothetical protein
MYYDVTDFIVDLVETHQDITEKIDYLRWLRKIIHQAIVKSATGYDHRASTLKSQLIEFVGAELMYWEFERS